MFFNKKLILLGSLLIGGLSLAMDPNKTNSSFLAQFNAKPVVTRLHTLLYSGSYDSIETALVGVDKNGNALNMVINVNEKSDGDSFCFSLLNKILYKDLKKKNREYPKILRCLMHTIKHPEFDLEQVNDDNEPLFCALLKTIDCFYIENQMFIENQLAKSEEMSEEAKEEQSYFHENIKNLYTCVFSLMNLKKFNPNFVIENKESSSYLKNCKRSLLQFWIMRINREYTWLKVKNNSTELREKEEQFIFEKLLNSGADTNYVDAKEYSPLHYITSREDDLFNAGKFHFPTSQIKNLFATEKELKIAEGLIRHGAQLDSFDKKGRTPLYFCVNDYTMARLLLCYGATSYAMDNDGELLINYALNPLNRELYRSVQHEQTCKKDINSLVGRFVAKDCGLKNPLNCVINRECGLKKLNTANIYPYSQAVGTYAKSKMIDYNVIMQLAFPRPLSSQDSEESESQDS